MRSELVCRWILTVTAFGFILAILAGWVVFEG